MWKKSTISIFWPHANNCHKNLSTLRPLAQCSPSPLPLVDLQNKFKHFHLLLGLFTLSTQLIILNYSKNTLLYSPTDAVPQFQIACLRFINSLKIILYVCIPGHFFSSGTHGFVSLSGPRPEQSFPPFSGAGLSHNLTRVLMPLSFPQVMEHSPQDSHGPYPPFTGNIQCND